LEANSITLIEITTAAIITPRSSTMPTAVMTESSENTASSTMICATTMPKLAYSALAGDGVGAPLRRARAARSSP
jgi:hypothetical protein